MSETATACRVVICDDQPGFRELLTILLAREPGIEVVGEAGDGRDVIELVRALKPNVLVLDIAMPEMDGIEALPHVLEASPETQVVMITGFGSDSVRRRALENGAHLFVEKGIDVEALVAQITGACTPSS